jgi:glycosyltransferase involved in cell wall biosynthesis
VTVISNNPLVSVIIPTYNRGQVIKESIESAIQQTYKNMEIIVVDDGSSDDTKAICEKYPKIKYIFQENSGASSARNNALTHASGDYIAFLDSDDVWHPDKTSEQMAFFDENDTVGLVFCDCARPVEGKHLFSPIPPRQPAPIIGLKEIVLYPYLGTPSVILKKEVLNTIGNFNTQLKSAEDLEFFIRIAEHYLIGYVQKTYVSICKSEGSLSDNAESYKDILKVYKMFFKRNIQFRLKFPEIEKRVYYKLYSDFARYLLCVEQPKKAINNLLLALRQKITFSVVLLLLKAILRRGFQLIRSVKH